MTFGEWVEAAGFQYLHPEMKATLHEAYQAGAKDMQEWALAKVRTRRLAWIRLGLTQTPRSDVVRTLYDELLNVVKDLEGLEVRR